MRRLYEPAAYAPENGAYWAGTTTGRSWPRAEQDMRCEVAVIGGGFTGLNAALALAEAGVDVALFEAERPGWGASGRNGGFCCIGGGLLDSAQMQRQFGAAQTALWHDAEKAAVAHVADLLTGHGMDADVQSNGEMVLAHSARAWSALQAEAPILAKAYGTAPRLVSQAELGTEGMGGPWHGGMQVPLGFALNPQKYHDGLSDAAQKAGARLFAHGPVTGLVRDGAGWRVQLAKTQAHADRVILATNGYSSENIPSWLHARYLPVQSAVIVTRVLTDAEKDAARWWSDTMAYDSRRLLHYFRLLPEGRFLFGMRGGLTARPAEEAAIAARIRQDFHRAFPAWKDVEITHGWSGLLCLMRAGTPFVGAVPDAPGLFAGLGFHGNGVAMGSYAGRLLADILRGVQPAGPMPGFLAAPPHRFPLGRHRRALLRPAYLIADWLDL